MEFNMSIIIFGKLYFFQQHMDSYITKKNCHNSILCILILCNKCNEK